MIRRKYALVALLISVAAVQAYYLPGIAMKHYKQSETINIYVNKMTSEKRQYPLDYYSLAFCRGTKVIVSPENIGEILVGDKIESTPYSVKMGVEEPCKRACPQQKQTLKIKEIKDFVEKIKENYKVNYILDNLPAAAEESETQNHKIHPKFATGIDIGRKSDGSYILYNHLDITVKYNGNLEGPGATIVGFSIRPRSVYYPADEDKEIDCEGPEFKITDENGDIKEEKPVIWSYSVSYERNDNVKWASRWDAYLTMELQSEIHWFSIINSLMIVLFLTGMVAMIMMRTLHADFKRYREMETQEEAQEETGWKLVHGDVFRPPSYPMLLSVFVGSGVQVIAMVVVTIVFALLGFLSPANRGSLMTALLVLYMLGAIFAGYFSARTYKILKGQSWKRTTFFSAFGLSGFWFVIFLVMNLVLHHEHSTGYVSFKWLFLLLVLWFGISIPLAFFGSYLGYKKPAPENPVRTNQIPRQIPEQIWYMKPIMSILMGGILPFGAIFIEMYFIFNSIWTHQFYYMFGFLFIVLVILIVTCAEITIVMCYFQLCSEDYHWWWRAFLTSAASAVYLFLYTIFFYARSLHIEGLASAVIYFGYGIIMNSAFFVMTGAVGFYSALYFVRTIYAVIKVD